MDEAYAAPVELINELKIAEHRKIARFFDLRFLATCQPGRFEDICRERDSLIDHQFQISDQVVKALLRNTIIQSPHAATMVDKHELRAMSDGHLPARSIVVDRKLEALLTKLPYFIARSGEESPAPFIGLDPAGIFGAHFRRVVLRVPADTDQLCVVPEEIPVPFGPPGLLVTCRIVLQHFLTFRQQGRLLRTRRRAARENEIGNPHLATQFPQAERFTRLID